MIIVSQDRKSIYNLNNIKSIDVLDNEIYITDNILSDEGACIGIYKTEKRAKEVLTEIMCKFSIFDIGTSVEFADLIYKEKQLAVYEMPEE